MTLFLLVSLSLIAVAWSADTTNFTVSGRKIMFSSSTTTPPAPPVVFKLRGFSYGNARIGEGAQDDSQSAGTDSLSNPDVCQQDFALMAKYNVNALKLYAFNVLAPNSQSLHTTCLDAAWVNKIFISLSVWIPSLPFASEEVRNFTASRYATMVSQTMHHPAVFAYSIGSEMGGDPQNNPTYWQDYNIIAQTIKDTLQSGGAQKLITTAVYQLDCTSGCNPPVPVLAHVISGEKYGAIVDVWGVDVYSPDPDEPNLRANIFAATKRPFVFPEYGVTFQPPNDTPAQGAAELALIQKMETYSFDGTNGDSNDGPVYNASAPIYAGGLVFEWNDEYWKGNDNCAPNPGTAQPWYGVNAVALRAGCTCPGSFDGACATNERVPRAVLNANMLPTVWSTYEPKF